jgi:hypothetical protein
MKKLWFAPIAAGVLTVGSVLSTVTAAHAATPAVGKPKVIQVRTASSVSLPDGGATLGAVESVSLPAGTWQVTTNLTAINFGAGDYVRCQIQAAGTRIDGGSTVYLADRVAGVVNMASLFAQQPTNVVVLCEHDSAAASSGQFYVDPGATITAVPTTSAKVVSGESTSQTTLNVSSPTEITSVSLPAGKWVLNSDASIVNFNGEDFDQCYLAPSAGSYRSDFTNIGSDPSDAIVANTEVQGTVTVPSMGSLVGLYCSARSTSGEYVDPGAAIVATKATGSFATLEPIDLPKAAGGSATLYSETVGKGTWRVTSAADFGNLQPNGAFAPGRDFLRCTLAANGTAISGGATVEITPDTYLGQDYNSGYYVAKGPWTLTLACSHDDVHRGSGEWAEFSGSVLAVKG